MRQVRAGRLTRLEVGSSVDLRGEIASAWARRQLSDAELESAIQAYLAGSAVVALAAQFEVDRRQIRKMLRTHEVQTPSGRFTEKHAAETVKLYDKGWSTTNIAGRLGSTPETIRRHLKSRGVEVVCP